MPDSSSDAKKTGKGFKPSDRIGLKKISGVENLQPQAINEVLSDSAYWIKNFYSASAGTRKVTCNIIVEKPDTGRHFSDNRFDLSRAEDLLEGRIENPDDQPFIFLSDLLNFVEQIRTSLKSNKNFVVTLEQGSQLDDLKSVFEWIGVHPSNNKITIEELKRIENEQLTDRIIKLIELIHQILAPSIGPLNTDKSRDDDEQPGAAASDSSGSGGISFGGRGGTSDDSSDLGGDEQNGQNRSDKNQRRTDQPPDQPRQPVKISELDSESKLYIQSLSIIAINQALNRYFNAESLAKLGLSPGMQVTFDQLPLEIRRQLMDRSFLQVETLLLGGKYSLDELISDSSQRINFSNQAALGLLMDVHGLDLINNAVRDIAMRGKSAEKRTKENEKKKLTKDEISQRIKNDKENILSTEAAQKKIDSAAADPDFARVIESELGIINDEKQLDKKLLDELGEITKYDSATNERIANNTRSIIDLLIQQGLPPEYLIPDPKNFDYVRFKNIFGDDIDQKQFNENKEKLANLIIFYWKRKRAIWAREIREEFSQEKLTPEEAQKLYEKIKKDPKKADILRNLGTTLNFTEGRSTAEELAGITEGLDGIDGLVENKAAEDFKAQQKDLIAKYLSAKLAELKPAEQQKTMKVYFEYYMPGVAYTTYNIKIFETTILPQINPMDLYMLQAGEAFGPGAFAEDESGYIQQAFDPESEYHGTGLMDSAIGQTGKRLAAEAIGDALYLIPGFGEGLLAAEASAPILKQIKNQLIEMGLEKIIEFVKKNWPWIAGLAILAALSSMLPLLLLLAPAAIMLRNGLAGIKDFFSGTGKAFGKIGEGLGVGSKSGTSLAQQTAAQGQGAGAQLPQGAKTLINQFSSSAMATAGQAVLATVGVATVSIFIYQTSLNSAFLTDFPKNESEINGSGGGEKTSKYAEISKTAVIKDGCASPENNGAKCENPSFPLSIEYTVTIKPKEDFSLQITDIKDTIKFKQSKKGWEEAGQAMPSIPSEKLLDFAYFTELIKAQGGLTDVPLSAVPTIGSGEIIPTPSETVPTEGVIVIPAGESLTFTYTLDELDSNYNHTAILNTVEANFYYQNSFMSGTDNVTTAARVCLGNCSAGAGCWPSTGTIWQLPFGDYSHSPPNAGGFGDSYDIGCDGCSGAAVYGPPVYANFDGNLCFTRCDDNQYGCRYILEFENEGQTYYEDFAHFQEPNPALSTPNTCMQVEAGFMIGLMSNRGMGSVHSHFGTVIDAGGGWWGSKPASSAIEQLMPETDNGNSPAKIGDHVTSCYD